MRDWLKAETESSLPHVQIILTALLYLQRQRMPDETCHADREHWLEIDYGLAADAAVRCGIYKCALFFVEVQSSQATRASRRISSSKAAPSSLLLAVYKNVDEPDSFYGVQQPSSLESIMNKFEYEKNGIKSLAFRGAHYDSRMRHGEEREASDTSGLIGALQNLDLNGLTFSLLRDQRAPGVGVEAKDDVYQSARRLEQWDLPVSETRLGQEAVVYRCLQSITRTGSCQEASKTIDRGILNIMGQVLGEGQTGSSMQSLLCSLAVLNEIDEVMASHGPDQLQEAWTRMSSRQGWMHTGRWVVEGCSRRDALDVVRS